MNKHLQVCKERQKKLVEEKGSKLCGSLSAFDIDGIRYEIAPENDLYWGRITKSMDCKLTSVLRKGMTFG